MFKEYQLWLILFKEKLYITNEKKKLFVMNYIEPTGWSLFIYEGKKYIYIYICLKNINCN